jgi:hypothetical protein
VRIVLLLGLFVLCVLAAAIAVLAERESVRIVLLVLHGDVIAFFAVITRQGYDQAIVFLSHGSYSQNVRIRTGWRFVAPALRPELPV